MEIEQKTGPQGVPTFQLTGVIDESVDFSKIVASPNHFSMNIDLYGIKRINSVGIKKWMIFFEQLNKTKVIFSFHRVAPAMVEQMVNISNFRCGGEVVSIVLPFRCKQCSKENFIIKAKSELSGINLESVPWTCEACGKAELEFDDIADEYLGFWSF